MSRIGLVLSGGGVNGLAHIGALKVLDKLGVKFSAIAGCSMGSIIGACYAAGRTPQEIEDFILKYKLVQLLDLSIYAISKLGITKTNKLKKALDDFMGVKKFEELKIPMYINATDLSKGKEVVFCSGELFKAIRASIAIPGVFAPPIIHKDYYVDGGVLDNVPFSILPSQIKKYIIIDAVPYEPLKTSKKPSLVKLLETSGRAAMDEIIRLRLKDIPDKNYVLVKPRIPEYKFIIHREKSLEIIRSGELATQRKIPEIKHKFKVK